MLATLLGSASAHGLAVTLARPQSKGRVWLRGADPLEAPQIELGLCSVADDVERLMRGVRAAWALTRSPQFKDLTRPAYYWREAIVNDDELLRRAVVRLATACWHATGTARMGSAAAPDSVVDERGRVHGLEGLHVADASVIPAIPSVPTNLSCLMLAERIAQWLR